MQWAQTRLRTLVAKASDELGLVHRVQELVTKKRKRKSACTPSPVQRRGNILWLVERRQKVVQFGYHTRLVDGHLGDILMQIIELSENLLSGPDLP